MGWHLYIQLNIALLPAGAYINNDFADLPKIQVIYYVHVNGLNYAAFDICLSYFICYLCKCLSFCLDLVRYL